jgi:predicted amidohydrolase YtcJ
LDAALFPPVNSEGALFPRLRVIRAAAYSCGPFCRWAASNWWESLSNLPDVILDNVRIAAAPTEHEPCAIVIAGGRIAFVGNRDTALAVNGHLRRIDCGGSVATPGFNDSHSHPLSFEQPGEVDLSSETSIDAVLSLLKGVAARTPAGEWIEAVGVGDGRRLQERRLPSTSELDAVSRNHLIYIRGGTQAAVNSVVLREAGLSTSLQGVSGEASAKNPNGLRLVHEIEKIAPRTDREQHTARLDKFLEEMAGLGITAVTDFGSSGYDMTFDHDLRVYETLREQKGLPTRCRVSYRVPVGADIAEVVADLRSREIVTGSGDDLLRVGPIKVVVDGGSFEGALLRSEYPGQSGYSGVQFIEAAEIRMLTEVALERRWQLAVHAIGGAAIDMVLEVWKSFGQRALARSRFSLQHAFQPSQQNIVDCKALGIVVGIQQPLFYGLANVIIDRWGYANAERSNPIRDWVDAGVKVAAGSDIAPRDPLLAIWSLSTRSTEDGIALGPDQAVGPVDGLRFYTVGSAESSAEEDRMGSLRPGYLADVVLLTDDPTVVPLDEIKSINVLATLVGGKPTFISREAPAELREFAEIAVGETVRDSGVSAPRLGS